MHDIRTDVDAWLAQGRRVALATVLRTWGSAPRPAGAALALTEDGSFTGSVSAGCVEGAVIEAAGEVLAGAAPRRLSYGVSDDRAWSLGLACGGEITLWVATLDPVLWRAAWQAVDARRAALWTRVVDGPPGWLGRECVSVGAADPELGTVGDPDRPNRSSAGAGHKILGSPELAGLLEAAEDLGSGPNEPARLVTLTAGRDELEVFVGPLQPRRRLVIVGATHIAQDLVRLAATLDLETVVVDPRAAFANRERFPAAGIVTVAWPRDAVQQMVLDADTAVAVLSHDPKLDDDVLALALRSAAGYVGALGSRRTQAERRERLAAMGLDEGQLARIHGPIGLDLGGRSPAEIALSILAQVVAVTYGRSGV